MHAARSYCTEAAGIQVTAADFTGKTEIVALERRALEDEEPELSFEFRKQRFCYDAAASSFHKLPYPVQVRVPLAHAHAATWCVLGNMTVKPASQELWSRLLLLLLQAW